MRIASLVAVQRLAAEQGDEFGLAIAGDAGDADDLAAEHIEGDVVEVDAVMVCRRQRTGR